jgi:sugar lactone lactonase YvrE
MIRAIDLSSMNVSTIAGDGTSGYADNADASLAKFFSPQGVCIVPGQPDLLYVADNNNHRIRKINLNASSVTTIAGNGAVPPASTFADNSLGMNAKFFYPTNLVVSPDAVNIYVADQGNFRVRKVKTDITTDIQGYISNDMLFDVYPNPAKDQLTISFKSQVSEKVKLEIFDQKGKTIMTDDTINVNSTTPFTKDITSLSNGMYLIKITTSKGFTTRKIILSGK